MSGRIFYFTSNPVIVKVFREALASSGYVVETAQTIPADILNYDVMAIDIEDETALEAIQRDLPPILALVPQGNAKLAASALRRGARQILMLDVQQDYVELLPIYIAQLYRLSPRRFLTDTFISKNWFKAIVKSIGEGLLITDGDDYILYANPRMVDLTGYSVRELLGKKASQMLLVPQDWADMQARNLQRMQNQAETYEVQVTRKDGSIFCCRVNATPLQDNDGNIIGTLGVLEDITLAKKTENALRESETRYRIVSEMISDYAFSYCILPDGRLEHDWATDSFTKVTGYTIEEIQSSDHLYHPDDRSVVKADLATVIAGQPTQTEYRIITKAGELRWLKLNRLPVWDEVEQRVVRVYGVAQDITERKLAEEKLRKSEARLTESQRIAKMGSWEWNKKDHTFYLSDTMTELLIIDPSAIDTILSTDIQLLHPDDIPQVQQFYLNLQRADASYTTSYRIMLDGEEHHFEIRGRGEKDATGEFYKAVGILQDVTDQRRAEEKLRKSEARLAEAQRIAKMGSWEWDVKENRIHLSDVMREMMAFEPTHIEATLVTALQLIHPDDTAQVQQFYWNLQRADASYTVSYRMMFQGQEHYFEANGRGEKDAAGEFCKAVGILQDVTERKRAEEALRKSNKRYQIISELISDYAYSYEIDEQGDLHFDWTTDSIVRVTNYTSEELGNGYRLYHPEDEQLVRQDVERTLAGNITDGEYRIVTKSGEVRWLHIYRRPIWDERKQRVVRFYGVAQDITARKVAEEKLRASEARLAEAQRIAKIGNWEWNMVEDKMYWSEAMADILQAQPTTFNETLEIMLPMIQSSDIPVVRRVLNDTLNAGTPYHFAFSMFVNGTLRYFEAQGRGEKDEQGKIYKLLGTMQDITERKQSEAALRKSEARLAEAQRIAKIGNWEWDARENKIDWSETMYEMFGVTPQTFHASYEEYLQLIHPDDREMLQKILQDAYQTGASYTVYHRVLFATGEVRFIEGHGQVELDETGQVRKLLGTAQDITERRRAEMETSRFYDGLRVLHAVNTELSNVETLDELHRRAIELGRSVLGFDRLGIISIHGEQMQGTFGTDIAGAIRDERAWQKTITPDDPVWQIMQARERVRFWNDIPLYDYEHLVGVGWKAIALLVNAGEVVGWISTDNLLQGSPMSEYQVELLSLYATTLANLISQKRTQETLRQSEHQFRLLFDNAPIGMATISMAGKFIQVNAALCYTLGYTENELLSLSIGTITYPEDAKADADMLHATIAAKSLNYGLEKRYVKKDGQIVSAIMRGTVLYDTQNQPTSVIGQVIDITERKRVEEAEKEQRRLSAALLDTAIILNSTLEFDEVLEYILAYVGRVVPHDCANIMLIENGWTQVAHSHGYEVFGLEEIPAKSLSVEHTWSLNHMTTYKTPLIVPDIVVDPRWVSWENMSAFHAYLGAPIILDEDVIGFINLDSTHIDFFTAEHARRLQAFTHHAAIAIKNARVYDQARQNAIAEERHRLARDLHDAVSQTLFSASVISETLPRLWKQGAGDIESILQELHLMVRGALAEMRTLLVELRPTALIEAQLPDLVKQLADAMTSRTGVRINFVAQGKQTLPPEVQIAFYRIAQESLNNITKHARAREVWVTVRLDEAEVFLQIQDNGRGFDRAMIPAERLGVSIMHERAASIHAKLEVESTIGEGTTLRLIWSKENERE